MNLHINNYYIIFINNKTVIRMIRHKATNSSPSAGSVSMKLKCLICTFVTRRGGGQTFSRRELFRELK